MSATHDRLQLHQVKAIMADIETGDPDKTWNPEASWQELFACRPPEVMDAQKQFALRMVMSELAEGPDVDILGLAIKALLAGTMIGVRLGQGQTVL